MRRWHTFIKGSEQELAWLNQQAARGWLLTGVHGSCYQFKATDQKYRIFSEYVTLAVAAEVPAASAPFEQLATVELANPAIKVIYTGSTQPALQQVQVRRHGDLMMELNIATAMRGHFLNMMNVVLFSGLLLIVAATFVSQDNLPEWFTDTYLTLWLMLGAYFLLKAIKIHHVADDLRVKTQYYDDAWLPTQHVFFEHLPADLNLDDPQLKSMGRWQLVGHDQKGTYWYDLQTLSSLDEIKQTLQAVVGPDVKVNVLSFLGLGPIGYL